MKKKTSFFLAVIFCASFSQRSFSQIKKDSAKISISGYADVYYAYYTDSVGDNNYQKFPSISPRSNQFGLNCANLTFQYDAEKIRSAATIQFGDIPRSTWHGIFNKIMEAHVGVRMCEKVWVDAGFFRTHFGTEGLLPKENITSSVAVLTYTEPYYESGIRLNYTPSKKLTINLFALNGYNMFTDNNSKKSFGALLSYSFSEKGNLNYSSYIGDDSPDSDTTSQTLIQNNIYLNYVFNKFKFQVGGDYCMKQNSNSFTGSGYEYAIMYGALATAKYQYCEKNAVYARYEMLSDDDGIMTGIMGLNLWGATIGGEYKPSDNSYVRIEGRQLNENKNIFQWENKTTNKRLEVMCHLGVSF